MDEGASAAQDPQQPGRSHAEQRGGLGRGGWDRGGRGGRGRFPGRGWPQRHARAAADSNDRVHMAGASQLLLGAMGRASGYSRGATVAVKCQSAVLAPAVCSLTVALNMHVHVHVQAVNSAPPPPALPHAAVAPSARPAAAAAAASSSRTSRAHTVASGRPQATSTLSSPSASAPTAYASADAPDSWILLLFDLNGTCRRRYRPGAAGAATGRSRACRRFWRSSPHLGVAKVDRA